MTMIGAARAADTDRSRPPVEEEYARSLLFLIRALQDRLREIESSRWWRARLAYYRWRQRLRRMLPRSGVFGWLQRLTLPFTSQGRRLARRSLTLLFRKLYLLLEQEPVVIVRRAQLGNLVSTAGNQADPYDRWCALNMPRPIDLLDYRERLQELPYRPTISILVPVYNPRPAFLEAALRSALAQVYPHWELCIADDASTDAEVRRLLEHFAAADPRVKIVYRPSNGNISAATNSALELATGEFCALLDHDDLLSPDALFQNVLAINRHRDIDLLYSDEDMVDEHDWFHEPHFKPQWSPDKLLSNNYITHLAVIRTALLREVGGLRVGLEGAQDHDLVLRITERTQRIRHIPRVLYHWRRHAGSTAQSMMAKPYALTAAFTALSDALERRGQPGTVQFCHESAPYFIVRYHIARPGRVSILVPTRDHAGVLKKCLRSIFARTQYADFEVVVIDNGSEQKETLQLLEQYRCQQAERFRVVSKPGPFNFSRLINVGAAEARGHYLLLLNNDTEVIHADWLGAMVEQAQRPTVGCVGVQLLFPNDTIQHAGVVLQEAPGHVWRGHSPHSPAGFDRLHTVNNYSAVTAACLMTRRAVFDEVGGFDEAFAVDFNDVDFCLRVREAGYHNVYLPHVRLYHHESLTRGSPFANLESARQRQREIRLLKARWWRYLEDDPCWSRHLSVLRAEIRLCDPPESIPPLRIALPRPVARAA